MSNNNYSYGDNYPPLNNRQLNSQSSQQSFSTSNAKTGSYYGLQTSATPARTYPNADYQYGQYSQQNSSNNASGGSYDWGVYSTSRTTPATVGNTLSLDVPEQRSNAGSKPTMQNNYDNSSLGNLAYASTMNYGSSAEAGQQTTHYSSANLYGGTVQTNGNSAAQRHTQSYDNRTTSAGSRTSQAQRHAPEQAPRANTGTAFSLPTPSPTYPQSLINTYPGVPTTTSSLPRASTSAAWRPSNSTDVSSPKVEQPAYTPSTSYNYAQPQKTTRLPPEQARKTQTPTPLVRPISRNTSNTNSNTNYRNQSSQSPVVQNTMSQSARAPQARPQPTATLSPTTTPVNVIRRIGDPKASSQQNINSQTNTYQPTPPALTATQSRPTQNYLPQPSQTSSGYQQQPAVPQLQPSPDRPTTVDPSHVYNRYHEYQKQIEAAEAEAARLAKLKEEQNAAEAARAAEQLRQDNLRAVREAEEAAATEAAKTLAQTMPADNAAESEEEEEQAEDNGSEDHEDEQQPADTGASADTSQNTAALTKPSNPASNEQPKPAVVTQAPAPTQAQAPVKEDAAESMEEEMRIMVEKLRDYQSKDPKLFLQVWSSVRKNGGGAGQSPQSQAEGSLAQGSPSTRPAEVPLASPSPAILQSEALPKAPVQEVVAASNPPSVSPMTAGQERMPSRSLSPNAKRRAKRPSRSKAAVAELAAAAAAKAAAKRALLHPSPAQALQPVADGQTAPAPVGSPAAQQLTQLGTETTPAVTPAPVGTPAANQRPQVGTQTAPAASTTPAGRPSHLNPSANPPPRSAAAWPNEQRDLIENTESTVLNAIPENAGKTIQPNQIRAMLEGNPSYMELCQMIEKMGFKMDRARFAKTLLAVIPHSSTRNPPASRPAQPLASGAGRNKTSGVSAYSTSDVSNGHPPSAVAQTSTQQSTPQAAPVAVMPTNAPAPPGGVHVSAPVDQPTPSPVRRGRGRPRKDAQRSHSKVKPPESVQAPTPGQAPTPVQAVQQESAMPTPQNYPPSSGPQPQNQGGSTPLNNEEIHQMSLLQAYVGKELQPTGQLSGGGANDSTRGDTQVYRSPYQPQSQPGPGGPAAASGYRSLLPASYEQFWNTNKTQAPLVNQQQGQQSQPQSQPQNQSQNQSPASNQPALARYPSFSHYHSALVGSPGQAGVSGVSAYHSSSIPVSNETWPGQPGGKAGGPSQASHIPAASRPQQVPNVPLKPLTKAEAARKRTFAEIIDLTKEAASKETVTSETGDEHHSKRSRVGDWNNNFPSDSSVHLRLPAQPPQPPQNTTSLTQPKTYQQFFGQQSHHINSRPATPQVEVIRNPLLEYDGIVKPIDSSVALRRSRYNPKTIARDVLISTGRHPTQRALNAHLEHLKGRFPKVDNSSDLSTFRWDIIDPGGLPVGSANMEALPGSSGYSSSHVSMRGQVRPSRGGSYGLTSTGVVPNRPSGLRNEINHSSDFAIVIPATTSASAFTPKRRGRPPRDPNATPQAETQKRPLGRPHRIPVIEQETPVRPTVDEYGNSIKRRGRQPKSAQKPVSRLSIPRYQAFLCEWKGCKAELLNLETLRKHILSVHGKTRVKDGIKCLWGKCAHEVIDLEDDAGRPENVFSQMEAWKEHVEKQHLTPLAWHMGDGPRGSTLDGNESDHSSYLLDSTGYQVTPSILEQAVESGSAAANNERRAAQRAARAQKKFSQWVYWCGPGFVPRPAIREGDFPARDADFKWQDPYQMLDEEYGDELRRAAKESDGLAPEKRVRVYSKDMPEELKRSLGVGY